jgi:hypothetical protein
MLSRNSRYPRTSKKHGKGQADGSGQVFHAGSLGRIIWDVQVEWVWVEFYSTSFVFLTVALTGTADKLLKKTNYATLFSPPKSKRLLSGARGGVLHGG